MVTVGVPTEFHLVVGGVHKSGLARCRSDVRTGGVQTAATRIADRRQIVARCTELDLLWCERLRLEIEIRCIQTEGNKVAGKGGCRNDGPVHIDRNRARCRSNEQSGWIVDRTAVDQSHLNIPEDLRNKLSAFPGFHFDAGYKGALCVTRVTDLTRGAIDGCGDIRRILCSSGQRAGTRVTG